MDATATERATLVAMSCGALWGTVLAADHPDRVDAIAYLGPAVSLAPNHPERDEFPLDEPLDTDEGWAKYNTHYWRRDYLDFLEFFFARCFNEPHSTKLVEDCIGWGLQTTPEALADATRGIAVPRGEAFAAAVARVRCPTVVIHGDRDLIRPHAQGEALAQATGGALGDARGLWTPPERSRSGAGQRAAARPDLATGAPVALEAGRLTDSARAVHLIADRSRTRAP